MNGSDPFRVCILTTVHPLFDTRIFHKQAKTLVKADYEATLIGLVSNRGYQEVNFDNLGNIPAALTSSISKRRPSLVKTGGLSKGLKRC